jgi:adenine-specific DNA-methyltransferase
VEKSRGRDGKDGSFDSDNVYIEGDNLEALKLLQRAYHGKVKMIYIDPPYNTGHDFVYKDKFGDTIKNYKEQTGQDNQSNPETSGRFHSDWCSMMYPRLKLARELLSNDGVIFISIDDTEVANLRFICDEVFGANSFISNLVWQKKFSRSNDAQFFSTMHDHILCYAKERGETKSDQGWHIGLLPRGNEIPNGYSNPDNDPRGLWTSVILSAKSGSDSLVYEITAPGGAKYLPPSGRYWSCSKETFAKWRADNRIWFGKDGNGTPRKKTFLNEVQPGLRPNSLLLQSDVGNNQEARQELKELFGGIGVFDGPKPVRFINTLETIANLDKDSIVVDFFSGSATTAEATFRHNLETRSSCRYILVQLPEVCPDGSEAKASGYMTICEAGEERIRRAGKKIAEEINEANKQLKLGEEPKNLPDIGFRVFTLDESGIAEPQNGQLLVDRRKDGRSDLDIIFEVMLKWGYELTYPIEKTEFAGYECYSVAAGDLICCMEPGLTVDALEAIAAERPRRVFIMDSVFGHDDSLKLDALAIFKHAEEKTQQKIELRTV